MAQNMRIVPVASNPSHRTNTLSDSHKGAPSAPGVHDTLRSNLGLLPSSNQHISKGAASAHPLEARLANWRATQDALKMEGLRRTYGIAEPIRRGMELKITREGEWRPTALGGTSRVHEDILSGRDTELDWEDVFKGDEHRHEETFHAELESRLKMNW